MPDAAGFQPAATAAADMSSVVAALPIAVLAVGADGGVTAANALAERLLGGRPVGRTLHELLGCQAAAELPGRLRAGGGIARLECRLGRAAWVALSASAAPWGGMLLALEDISARKVTEATLKRQRDEAEEQVRARMRFFAAASHDLRQPLQALALFVSALEHHIDKPQTANIFSSLKVSLKSMEEMFDSLLDMSRLDAGVLTPERTAFMIGDVLETLETEFAPVAEQAGIRLRFVPSSHSARSDQAMLTRIVRNFVSNAVRYTGKGGKVLVGCRRRGDSLRIEVWDTGIGIPEDQVAQIFAEFYRGKTAEKRKGSGLGLAIVQRLARLLGHRLDLRSTEGKGSCFAVEVPLADSPAVDLDLEYVDAVPAPDVSGATVLVIDDDLDILDGVRTLMAQWGGRALTATSPEEALRHLEEVGARPDLVLVDQQLTTAVGGEPAIRVIEQALGAEVPSFVFTGAAEPSGDYPVLRKPLQAADLRAVVADALGR